MPHTNRKKKIALKSSTPQAKPNVVHTKRQQLEDDAGWTHIVETPRARGRGNTVSKAADALHVGDFEINGVSYVNRTLKEMKRDYGYWKKSWEDSDAYQALMRKLDGKDEVETIIVEKMKKLEETDVNNDKGALNTADGGEKNDTEEGLKEAEEKLVLEDTKEEELAQEDTKGSVKLEEKHAEENVEENGIGNNTVGTTEVPVEQSTERSKVDNAIVLGLGSLQSARREGRRASATQLAALQTIIKTLGEGVTVAFQDPQFTTLDKEFLTYLGYEVLEDPEAFARITEGSLVYGIHCYAQVYKAVSEGPRPAVHIGTDVDNFGRFNLSETTGSIQKDLDEMVEDCEIIGFPQVRHDFSDTNIYWRKVAQPKA